MKEDCIQISVVLFSLFCAVSVATTNGEELMNNDTIEIISLNQSQYCFVNNNTIRIDLNATTQLSIIDSSEDVIMAKAIGNDSVIFTAPLNGSRCMDDNEDGQLSTTLYIIQMIIYSITILFSIVNVTLHLVIKDLHTISGILVIILCISVIIATFISMGSLINIYVNNITVLCGILINFLHELSFAYQAAKLSVLYQFAYLMYQSYKLKPKQKENIKKSVLIYILFIIASSTVCLLLALAIDIGANGNIYSDIERYCRVEFDSTVLYLILVYGEFTLFIILQCITFAVGLTLYFLVTKKCCAMKSTNLRVTMALVATVGINILLLIILTIAEVSQSTLVVIVTSGTLIEQIILLALFLSSKKVLIACKAVCAKATQQSSNNMINQQSDMSGQV